MTHFRSEVLEKPKFPFRHGGHFSPIDFGVIVVVLCVTVIADIRHDRGLQLLVVDVLPVEGLEPSVALDVLGTVLHVPQALRAVLQRSMIRNLSSPCVDTHYLDKELFDEVLGDGIDVTRPVDFSAQDLFVDREGVIVEKRRVPSQHFVDEDAKCPPIDGSVVA